jgi:hypothetical protein
VASEGEGSDSDDQAIEPAPSGRRTRMKMKRLMQLVAKKGNLRKLFASLKKVKIDDEEVPNIAFLDETQAVEDLTQDSDEDSDGQDVLETLGSSSTPKPSLRPFFPQSRLSLNNLSETETETIQASPNPQQEEAVIEESPTHQGPITESSTSDTQQTPDEGACESDTQISSQVASLLSSDPLPSALLLVDKTCLQGKKLLRLLRGLNGVAVVVTRKATETKDAISTALLRLYNICHRSVIPYCLRIGLAGDEQFYSQVLQAFVDTAAKKTVNWPELVRFIPIHLGLSRLTNFIVAADPAYRTLFADQLWSEFLEGQANIEGSPDISKRILKLFQSATTLHCITVAQALLQCKFSEQESSQTMVPFVCDLQLGYTDLLKPTDGEVVEEPTSVSSLQSLAEGSQAEALQSAVSSQSTSPSPSHNPSDHIDLQVDYWTASAGSKKDAGTSKVTLKGQYRSLSVCVMHEESSSGLLSMIVIPRERHKKGMF